MPEKRLYTVTIETQIVVIASDSKDAEKAAKGAIGFGSDIDSDQYDINAREMRRLPSGWDLNAIPFGDGDKSDPNRTIQGWLDVGAGVFYLEERERLRKVRESLGPKKEGADPTS